jgi:hypothetical protein
MKNNLFLGAFVFAYTYGITRIYYSLYNPPKPKFINREFEY